MVRVVIVAVLGLFLGFLAGCEKSEAPAFLNNVKIGDLKTLETEKLLGGPSLRTANFDVHIYEIPAENIAKLGSVWESLHSTGLTFYNYRAFSRNLFRVGAGKRFNWSGMNELLVEAGAKKMAVISPLLPDGQIEDIRITGLGRPQQISFIDRYLLRDKPVIGPGNISMRLTARHVPGARDVAQLICYPTFTVPMTLAEGPMAELARRNEVQFKAAGFGLKMSPNEFVMLGPSKFVGERGSLGGLFFTNLDGTLFMPKGKRPTRKVSVRLFVIVCTAVNYFK